jgi:pyruvate,water dikinase
MRDNIIGMAGWKPYGLGKSATGSKPGGHVPTIVWFENYQPTDAPSVGGKNSSLGTLFSAGLPVPPGFAVSAHCYRNALADGGLTGELDSLTSGLNPRDTAAVAAAGVRARALIGSLDLADELAGAIRDAYAELCGRCGDAALPVAVRSSATCEDQPDASFAGEHDTYLWVRGADEVVRHVLRCWASLFTDRGIAYRLERGYTKAGEAMSVGVQQMVTPRAAGVAFTLNPSNGDRSQIAIDASWGFGEAVVSGEVTPDNFLVDKVMGTITRRTISAKTLEYRLTSADAVTAVEVEAERQSVPCLTDEEICAVAKLARRAEKHYRCPQDVEWALEGEQNVLLLQSRPETVWSRRPRQQATVGIADPITSMVQTLLHPVSGGPAAHG